MTDRPKASPRPPDDSAPLDMEKTPVGGAVSPFGVPVYVKGQVRQAVVLVEQRVDEKLAEVRGALDAAAREAATEQAAKEHNGKPVIPASWVPYFYVGFVTCSAVTTVLIGDASVPAWLLKVAAVGTLAFGGLIAGSPGLRKGAPK